MGHTLVDFKNPSENALAYLVTIKQVLEYWHLNVLSVNVNLMACS